MGCDIHAYVETTRSTPGEKEYWTNFGSEFRLDRNYGMFGFLAGVRSGDTPIIAPRGLPNHLAWQTEDDAFLRISEEYAADGYCSLDDARRYQTYGCNIQMRDGKPVKVDHPDWHSRSWLTPTEFEKVIAAYEAKYITGKPAVDNRSWLAEYAALSAAMKTLQEFGLRVRLVFWFDN